MYSDTIQSGLNPLILISSCALLLLSGYNRFIIIVERIRKFDRELLEEVGKHNEHTAQIKVMYHNQLKRINKQAQMVKFSILCLLTSVLSSLVVPIISLSIDTVASLVFTYIALALMFFGILLLVLEIAISLDTVIEEERIIREISLPTLNLLHSSA